MNGNKKNEGSDIFGNGDAEASPQKPKSQRNSSNIFGVDEDTPSACPPKQSQSAPTRQDEDDGNRPAGRSNPQGGNTGNPVTGSGYQPGSDAQQRSRGGYNPITGEAYGPESGQPQARSGKSTANNKHADTRPW